MRSLLRRAWYVASASALLAGCGSLGPSDASPPVLDPSRAIVVFDGNSLVAGAVWPGSAADRIDLR
ncbi:MAG TPA: hypothetical protein VFR37_08890, partial [Longimicrobium sp.]|nr:hypothetical protein [Longimicrobium sp.]